MITKLFLQICLHLYSTDRRIALVLLVFIKVFDFSFFSYILIDACAVYVHTLGDFMPFKCCCSAEILWRRNHGQPACVWRKQPNGVCVAVRWQPGHLSDGRPFAPHVHEHQQPGLPHQPRQPRPRCPHDVPTVRCRSPPLPRPGHEGRQAFSSAGGVSDLKPHQRATMPISFFVVCDVFI